MSHGNEQRDLKEDRDFKRKPRRDRFLYRARGVYWRLLSHFYSRFMSARNSDEAIMADVTYYVALPFGAGDDGPEPREAVECTSANAAIRSAERMARTEGHIGAVAFSRTGDPGSGEFADAVLLKAFGEVPSDLSTL